MSRRHADNWSHPGHYLVDPYTWSWSPIGHGHGHEWHTAIPFVQCQSTLPFWDTAISKSGHENPWSRSCVWSKVKLMFELQNSKVKVKPIDYICGLEFNRYVCFSFCGNRTTFGWDIGNSIFDLKNSRSRSWPRSNLMVTFEALEFNPYVCFPFGGNRTILAEILQILYLTLKIQGQGHGQDRTRWSHLSPRVQSISLNVDSWQSDHFWLRYSKFHIWPWKI